MGQPSIHSEVSQFFSRRSSAYSVGDRVMSFRATEATTSRDENSIYH